MRHTYFILPLLLPLCAFGQANNTSELIFSENPVSTNSMVKSYSNEAEVLKPGQQLERINDYPTQIIRMSYNLENQQIDCHQANKEVENKLVKFITADKFTYNIYFMCVYDPETYMATRFTLHSYFDPINDKGIEYLKTFLDEHNGSDFLGTKLSVESARGLVVSLNIIAGVKKNPRSPLFTEYRKDRSNFYFKSNYEMRVKLVSEIYENFFSNDPEKVFPFLNKWVYAFAENIYRSVLLDANYVELEPERIFLMNSGEEIFVSNLKYYFAHNCNARYENHRCLEQQL